MQERKSIGKTSISDSLHVQKKEFFSYLSPFFKKESEE